MITEPRTPDLVRSYSLNMPQMALGGLSEAWLFREFGAIHWAMIAAGLGLPSSLMADANGDRLYATFTRIRYRSTVPLLRFCENEALTAEARIARFGGGVFFGDVTLAAGPKRMEAEIMSSFTKRSQASSNVSLLKGQPVIPAGCPIAELNELPAFAQEYRQTRATPSGPVLAEVAYEILPYHDINGVGLLYFAAYPTINDLCELRASDAPQSWCLDTSTVMRDVHYYGNCDLSDSLAYRIHARDESGGTVRFATSLNRTSDGAAIALMATEKAVGLAPT